MKRGFTLIEIMVAVSLFSIVAVIVTGALITTSDVNRKAQAIKLAMDNVAFAMDSMVFNLREGVNYGCIDALGDDNTPSFVGLGITCAAGGKSGIIFVSQRIGLTFGKKIIYRFKEIGGLGKIQIASELSSRYIDLTSPEVDINSLTFYVPGGGKVRGTIVVNGQVIGQPQSDFNLQTAVMAF